MTLKEARQMVQDNGWKVSAASYDSQGAPPTQGERR